MKKIAILILMLTLSVHAGAASTGALNQGGASTGGLNQGGASTGDLYNPNVDSSAYDPKVDPSAYGNQTPRTQSGSGFSSGKLDQNQFSAQSNGVPKLSLLGLVYWIIGVMNQVVYLIIGLALISFLYGVLKMSFIDGHKPEAREQARKFMFWGIVSLFVMMSVWGLVGFLKVTFFGPGDLIIPRLK